MNREWLTFRLHRPSWTPSADHPDAALSVIVSDLSYRLRDCDPDGHWRFHRRGDGIEVDVRSTTPVLDDLERRLREQTAERHWPLDVLPRTAASVGDDDLGPALATLSSQLALDLISDGALRDQEHLGISALHVRMVSEMVPDASRASFLFLCWQHFSATTTPAHRLRLGKEAEELGSGIVAATERTALAGRWAPLWSRYAAHLGDLVGPDRVSGTPLVNYLLFEHVLGTHDRLAVSPTTAALVARALRTSLLAGQVDGPVSRLLLAQQVGSTA